MSGANLQRFASSGFGSTGSGRSGRSWKVISRFWFWFREVMTYMSVGFFYCGPLNVHLLFEITGNFVLFIKIFLLRIKFVSS